MADTSTDNPTWDMYAATNEPLFQSPEISLGPWTSYGLVHDPKHLAFVLGRYKFVAKMLQGRERVMEVGPGDGFGLPLVAQAVEASLRGGLGPAAARRQRAPAAASDQRHLRDWRI